MTTDNPEISLVIPLHNEEEIVEALHARLQETLSLLGRNWEVILVDDGSRDATAKLISGIAARDPHFRVIVLRRNFGQTAAIMAGIDHASGSIIVPMDADLQNDPKDIGPLLDKLGDGYDVVSGWRRNRRDPGLRSFASRLANRWISRISGVHLHDYGCTLKAYRRDVIEGVRLYGEMHRFVPIYAAWQGGRIAELEVSHRPRRTGKSNYGWDRSFKVILDLLVVQFLMHYDTKPIYVFGVVGAGAVAVSILSGMLAVYLRFFESVSFIQTPLPLLTVLTFLTGVICILMGLMTELLVRIYYESQGKPAYLIRDTANISPRR